MVALSLKSGDATAKALYVAPFLENPKIVFFLSTQAMFKISPP